jgi:MoaA/NifB/PqqE/SkfB family radical SAM enzyme
MSDDIKDSKIKLNTFTSTGIKLMRHGDTLAKLNQGIPTPVSLQIAPTEICSLDCKFCSVMNRSYQYVFDWEKLKDALDRFFKLGVQTVEISGGGDPLLYPQINELVAYCLDAGKKVGLITNGIGINKRLDKSLQARISWLRISANTLDYRDHLDLPSNFNPEGTLGFSYCWTENLSTEKQLLRVKEIADNNNVKYIRLVPNCLDSNEDMVNKWDPLLEPMAERLGHPVFYQPKNFGSPDQCFLGYIKPFLYADEYVYPCSSTVLNSEADKQFNSSFRWFHYSKVEEIYSQPMSSIVDTKRCEHCVFVPQNNQLIYAINKHENEEFF